jgi:regulator of RNase E activity RraA
MSVLSPALVDALRRLDACIVSNAVETFDVRLRNEGIADGSVRAQFDRLPPVVGHAVTTRIRSSAPPPVGHAYVDRTDWWSYITKIPPPRIVIAEDIDDQPGAGAFVGELHATILQALDCVAYATNGAVRDLDAVERMGFQFFAGSRSVSHAFAHIVDFGGPVTIGGLGICSGDLIYGDRHGLLTLPPAIAAEIPAAAAALKAKELQIIDLCRSQRFSLDALRTLMRQL